MDKSHIVSLLQNGIVTVNVMFNDSDGAKRGPYTYKATKDQSIVVGDQVIVDSPSKGMTVVEVVAVHKTPKIAPDAKFRYKWIVQKIDRANYERRIADEDNAIELLNRLDFEQARKVLIDELHKSVDNSEARDVFNEALNSINASTK